MKQFEITHPRRKRTLNEPPARHFPNCIRHRRMPQRFAIKLLPDTGLLNNVGDFSLGPRRDNVVQTIVRGSFDVRQRFHTGNAPHLIKYLTNERFRCVGVGLHPSDRGLHLTAQGRR